MTTTTLGLLAALATQTPAPAQQVAGLELEFGGAMWPIAVPILCLAFLLMVGEQFLAMRSGAKADWPRPFIRTGAFILLLALYTPFSQGIIAAVKAFGAIDDLAGQALVGEGETSRQGVLAARAAEFAKVRDQLDNEAYWNKATASEGWLPSGEDVALAVKSAILSAVDKALWVLTWITFTFAAFAVFALKILATAATKILLEVGPAMIAFAAIPGLTSRYLSAWAMALIEITAWGVVARIVYGLMLNVNAKSAGVAIMEDANYAEHIILNCVYAALFLAVPSLTHMVLAGAASSVGSTGLAAAVGAAAGGASIAGAAAGRSSGAAMNAAAGALGAGAGAAAGAAKSSAGGGSRIGDGGPAGGRDMRALHAKRGAIEKQNRERQGD